ncbi:venom metalloproteinase antarease-like TtrivMP_A isoform X2 [Dermacentor silvarum]|uniref:venom metalloproteinase antarease-like TtrivMP_A isoform X2 n=1 Tax=Dermacentor silvarum TaxID=543639 RepID=UPI0021017D23|nr:venom metalloproteinase antarease-like TtrivMP_A isoform X2 [Dermacentor silvarum]
MLIFISILRSTTTVLQILLCISLHSYETECATLTGQQNIVFPKLLDSRSINGAKVLQINQDLTLNLEKSSVLSKNFLLRTYEDNIMKHTYRDGEVLEEGLYHDARTFSSVMLSEDNGLQVEGVLGPKLRIKPLMGEIKVAEGSVAHVLYEVTEDKINNGVNDGVRWERSLNVSERDDTRDDTNDVVLVELLVAVDSTFRSQFRSVTTLLRYLTITMNSANLRYTTVKNPSVKIKFHALEILTEYMETFLYRVDHYVASYRSLESFRDYVEQHPSKYSAYDAVYLFTGLDMAKYNGYGWDMQLQGIAYVGGTCTNRKVGIGEDKVGTFFGVRIFAHELGHLLGCPHDGEAYGIYSSVNCPWHDGYIMSYKVEDSRSMQFSSCCNNMIRLHVRGKTRANAAGVVLCQNTFIVSDSGPRFFRTTSRAAPMTVGFV